MMKEKAYFVKRPRRLDDLKALHPLTDEEPYEIIKEVALQAIDYENFTEDMLAARAFLEGIDLTAATQKRCIFVRQRSHADGVLVVPTTDGHVLYAAYRAPSKS